MYELKDTDTIFIFTGPNGAGRRTVAQMSGDTLGVKQVLSYTTRTPRSSEVDGQDYFFITRDQFAEAEAAKQFIEVLEIDGNLYGIKEQDVASMLQKHGAIYLILNRYGADVLKQVYGDHAVRIFIYADRQTVLRREQERGDSPELIDRYMSHYDEEIAYKDACEHVFENVDLAHTVFDLTKTLDQKYLHRNLLDLD
ncbi:guanylate kinase [Paenibacillus sp. GD4]|jgi:guanylate kinase|uniref:guanylate kinase n=1 Tax=Paenibacillus sp. GD4 TaxID=3068890 RepID=UPI002796A608|nr:guanylate kinase [Paenibacillus sp. GD4]MDQ1911507.1 guanylate kinase [Paenibacillus sp. GD4]